MCFSGYFHLFQAYLKKYSLYSFFLLSLLIFLATFDRLSYSNKNKIIIYFIIICFITK
jgi:hypothetical protein